MRRFLKENSLSIVFLVLFLSALAGQAVAGHADFNEQQVQHGDPEISMGRYLVSSDFGVDVMENWQSEYLQFTLMILASRTHRAGPRRAGSSASSTRTLLSS